MTLDEIADLVVSEFGQDGEDYFRTRLQACVRNRHRQIYQSFDWTAAQETKTIPVVFDPNIVPTELNLAIGDAENVISVQYNSDFLDPVNAKYIYENHPEMLTTPGKPQFYWPRFNVAEHSASIRLFPVPDAEGSINVLYKKAYDETATEPLLPAIEEVLIEFVRADAWQLLRQVGIYGEKLKEATALLVAAQQRDTPTTPKPRASKILTADGSTLGELLDSVCDIVGRWEPDIRDSARDRIRRNYSVLWDMMNHAESIVLADVPVNPDQQQIVLPHFIDRVIGVRLNSGGPIQNTQPLEIAEISYYFKVAYSIFEQSGESIFYSMLPSVATEVLPPRNEKLVITSYDKTFGGGPLTRHPRPDTHFNFPAFVKGYSNGTEYAEKVDLITYAQQAGPVSIKGSNSYGITENSYDTPLTISKPQTDVEMKVFGATSGMLLLTLPPGERERKHLRIAIYPNLNPRGGSANVVDAGRALICGKLKVSPLLDDNDSPQLRNVNNILINAAAADIFDRLGNAEMAKKYQEKAAAQTEIFIKAETNQNAYQPKIVPYTENYRRCGRRLF